MNRVTINNYQTHPSNGLNATLKMMKHLEQLSFRNPRFVKFVNETFGGNCITCKPYMIWKYMRENFVYVPDVPDEKLTAPYVMIETREGDCDDFSLFAKTVLDILGGFNVNYMILGKKRNQFSHIVTRAQLKTNSMFQRGEVKIVDGASGLFNAVDNKYIFRKIIKG